MINVTIINDNVFELTESFGISLSLPDSASSRVTLAADPAQVTILDDDGQFPLYSVVLRPVPKQHCKATC